MCVWGLTLGIAIFLYNLHIIMGPPPCFTVGLVLFSCKSFVFCFFFLWTQSSCDSPKNLISFHLSKRHSTKMSVACYHCFLAKSNLAFLCLSFRSEVLSSMEATLLLYSDEWCHLLLMYHNLGSQLGSDSTILDYNFFLWQPYQGDFILSKNGSQKAKDFIYEKRHKEWWTF